MTPFEIDDAVAECTQKNPASLGGDVDRWFTEFYEARCQTAKARLENAGFSANCHVIEGEPNAAIHREMALADADLLVIAGGARLKNIALDQIGQERYPVFVVNTASEGSPRA